MNFNTEHGRRVARMSRDDVELGAQVLAACDEIDRLRDTLTATERDRDCLQAWLFATQDELVKLTDALRAAAALADALDEFPLRACGLCARETIAALAEYRTVLAAARVVVSADPPEEGT